MAPRETKNSKSGKGAVAAPVPRKARAKGNKSGTGSKKPLRPNPTLGKNKSRNRKVEVREDSPSTLNPALTEQAKLGPGIHELRLVVPQPPPYARWSENIMLNLVSAVLGWTLGTWLMIAHTPPAQIDQPTRELRICAPATVRDANDARPPSTKVADLKRAGVSATGRNRGLFAQTSPRRR